MLREYFLKVYEELLGRALTDRELNTFLKDMPLTIRVIDRMIKGKVQEYVDKTKTK